jgi:hypothetical protein
VACVELFVDFGIAFDDRGSDVVMNVPGEWRMCAGVA